MNTQEVKDSTASHLLTAVIYTALSVVMLGVIYPVVMTGVSQLLFHNQANGSLVYVNGKPVASAIIGQLWTKPQYFHGRPSAAGKGYDPTSTGGTNLGPTSKKLIDATKATIVALRKENPQATGSDPDGPRHLERAAASIPTSAPRRRTIRRRASRPPAA